jgi:SET domain-containing protein
MKEPVYVRKAPDRGWGIFAARDIAKDEIILEFNGPRVKIEDMEGIPREVWDHLFNVGVDEYIIAREHAVRTNHSCDPNAGIVRDVFLAAMRDIKKDEEITFDYSTITADNWTMECRCGSPRCRKTIGNYIDLPDELKKKYDTYTPDWIKALRP